MYLHLKHIPLKKTFLISFFILSIFVSTTSAQKYNELKRTYNYHKYLSQPDDHYNPTVSGLCSLLIPGLGQVVCGETLRGIAFNGGFFGCYFIWITGGMAALEGYEGGKLATLAGLGGMSAIYIWSMVDANHIAKVKNMYFQDKKKTSHLKFEVAPYIEQLSINNQNVTPVGMTMRLKF